MASIIKANQIQDFGGNSIITSDGSGTVTINSAQMKNTPAFEAHSNAGQSLSDNTYAKVALQTEILDTDNNFDNSSNYRFTPTTAGKYYFEGHVRTSGSAQSSLRNSYCAIYKNGSFYKEARNNFGDNDIRESSVGISAILDMNGSSDYVELYAAADVTTGSASLLEGTKANYFLGYKIIGA